MRRLILLSVAALGIAACEQAIIPTIAGLGGTVSTDTTSRNNPSTSTLVIVPNKVQLTVGTTFQFATNAPLALQNQVQWNSRNTTVVTISPTGLATAVGSGTATVEARFTFDTVHVATATVTVTGTAAGTNVPRGM